MKAWRSIERFRNNRSFRKRYVNKSMEILSKHRNLLKHLMEIVLPWRKLTIGIDGADGTGKSPLARFLSWQLGMPTIETDMFVKKGKGYPHLRYSDLMRLIDARHSKNRPVIIEGIFLLQTLERINIAPDILIYVVNSDFDGSYTYQSDLKVYRDKYRAQDLATFTFHTNNDDHK